MKIRLEFGRGIGKLINDWYDRKLEYFDTGKFFT